MLSQGNGASSANSNCTQEFSEAPIWRYQSAVQSEIGAMR